jgi:hypothetical protein
MLNLKIKNPSKGGGGMINKTFIIVGLIVGVYLYRWLTNKDYENAKYESFLVAAGAIVMAIFG